MKNDKMTYCVNNVPQNIPIDFMQDIIPGNKLVHKGMFSPDLEEYYYTVSDKNFEQFDIYVIKKDQGIWSKPEPAFFNSKFSEHGMSFSPDGNTIYFSSTRPVNMNNIPQTWHIWKCNKLKDKWGKPVFVDIPNLRNKLVSHPSVTNSGKMYFHASNLDYSEMDIYYSEHVNGKYQYAEKLNLTTHQNKSKCTPYVSPNEDYLLFATIGPQLDLMICFKDKNGSWNNAKILNHKINNNGQGNPYVTPDSKFLFFTTGDPLKKKWSVKWINIEHELKNNEDKL